MKITIKVLKGQDCTLDVTHNTSISQIKEEVEKQLKIPYASQKLLFLGRTLHDEHTIAAYSNIRDGTKLNLIVMRTHGLRDVVYRSFRKYYNEQQSERLSEEFVLDFEGKMKHYSMDDVERLAENMMFLQ